MRYIIIFTAILLNLSVTGQFAPAVTLAINQGSAPRQIVAGDFNNDGLQDILVSINTYPNEYINLYMQGAGGQFSVQQIVNTNFNELVSVEVADLDNNGWLDFAVVCRSGSNYLSYWYQNTNTTFTRHFVDSLLPASSKILLRDFNNDGFIDMLLMEHIEITLRYANAQNTFSTRNIIHSGNEFYAIDAADYNGDGFLDVSVGSDGFEILLNTGVNGLFTNIASTQVPFCFGLKSGDLDGDGDTDIAAFFANNGLLAFSNNGSGNFTFKDTIIKSTDNFKQFGLKDFDCDGDLDVYTSLGQLKKVIWIPNIGLCDFNGYNIIYQTFSLAYVTASADLDNNGAPDIISACTNLEVSMNTCITTSIDEKTQTDCCSMYPNPSSGFVTLKNESAETLNYIIYDVLGKVIDSFSVAPKSKEIYENLFPGIYLIKAVSPSGQLMITNTLIVTNK